MMTDDDGPAPINVTKTHLDTGTSVIMPGTEGLFLKHKASAIFDHFGAPKVLKSNETG